MVRPFCDPQQAKCFGARYIFALARMLGGISRKDALTKLDELAYCYAFKARGGREMLRYTESHLSTYGLEQRAENGVICFFAKGE